MEFENLEAEVLLNASEALFEVLVKAIAAAKARATFFKRTFEHLEKTLKNLKPILLEIRNFENVATNVCEQLLQDLDKANCLLDEYTSTKRWKLKEKMRIKKQIREMDASLERFMKFDFQAEQLRHIARVESDTIQMRNEINRKMDQIILLIQGLDAADDDGEETNHEATADQENESSNPVAER